jgi:D-3-phosphoglycerate dehydrogenase / 2-oxoglutarate reductase
MRTQLITPADIAFDFDSTVISKETLDELIRLSLQRETAAKRAEVMARIETITTKGMNGDITLQESLQQRLSASHITQQHVDQFSAEVIGCITPGLSEVISSLQLYRHRIFIVSGGFTECISPVAKLWHLPDTQYFGNSFLYNELGVVTGIDTHNPLTTNTGKSTVLAQRKNPQRLVMVGDGSTDLEAYTSGVAQEFIALAAHQARPKVLTAAPHICFSTDELRLTLESLDLLPKHLAQAA